MVRVSARGAQETVEPLARGVSTRLVVPRRWQGRDWREAPSWLLTFTEEQEEEEEEEAEE